jgi:Tol biopolymer transport system component
MSLDVSPDGKTIVFDLLGDIYTVPMSGGSATRITSGSGFDGSRASRPTAKSIVFVSDRSGSEKPLPRRSDGQHVGPLTRGPNTRSSRPTSRRTASTSSSRRATICGSITRTAAAALA